MMKVGRICFGNSNKGRRLGLLVVILTLNVRYHKLLKIYPHVRRYFDHGVQLVSKQDDVRTYLRRLMHTRSDSFWPFLALRTSSLFMRLHPNLNNKPANR